MGSGEGGGGGYSRVACVRRDIISGGGRYCGGGAVDSILALSRRDKGTKTYM